MLPRRPSRSRCAAPRCRCAWGSRSRRGASSSLTLQLHRAGPQGARALRPLQRGAAVRQHDPAARRDRRRRDHAPAAPHLVRRVVLLAQLGLGGHAAAAGRPAGGHHRRGGRASGWRAASASLEVATTAGARLRAGLRPLADRVGARRPAPTCASMPSRAGAGAGCCAVARRSVRRFSRRFGAYDSPRARGGRAGGGLRHGVPGARLQRRRRLRGRPRGGAPVVVLDRRQRPVRASPGSTSRSPPTRPPRWRAAFATATRRAAVRVARSSVPRHAARPRHGLLGQPRPAYQLVVYDTGACVLRWLERRIGRRRMTAFLRLLVSRHRHGVVTEADAAGGPRRGRAGPRLKRFLRFAHVSG